MIRKFFRLVFYYGVAIIFCLIGTISINMYLTEEVSLMSVFGIIGGLILIHPAITGYAKKIKDFFEIE